MTGKFRLIASHTLRWEGGYVMDPDDPGGETKYGISKRAHPGVDIKSLSWEGALAIYYKEYWLPSRAAEIDWLPLSAKYYDLTVNMGTRRGAKLLQRAVNRMSQTKLAVDGYAGPKTLYLSSLCDPRRLLDNLLAEAKSFYRRLVAIRPVNQKYWDGWMNRLESICSESYPLL